MKERPDFFIVGAMKCGTTALFSYLSQHPSVYMPPMKEPKFFCTDLKTTGGVYTAEGYRTLFASAPADCLTGEASAMYLYSKVAIERIMRHNPDAKVIGILRYPVDAAHSLHAARWGYRHENIESFEDAWRAQASRLAGKNMPPGWPDPVTLQYGPIYRYAEQVRRVLDHVPKKQRLFIVYEDFFADPRSYYPVILKFLDLAPISPATFPVVNPTPGPKSHRLDRFLRKPPRWLKMLYAPVRPLFGAIGFYPGGLAWKLNSVPRRKPKLDPAFRSELDRYFAEDVAETERLLGRRLWLPSSDRHGAPRNASAT